MSYFYLINEFQKEDCEQKDNIKHYNAQFSYIEGIAIYIKALNSIEQKLYLCLKLKIENIENKVKFLENISYINKILSKITKAFSPNINKMIENKVVESVYKSFDLLEVKISLFYLSNNNEYAYESIEITKNLIKLLHIMREKATKS